MHAVAVDEDRHPADERRDAGDEDAGEPGPAMGAGATCDGPGLPARAPCRRSRCRPHPVRRNSAATASASVASTRSMA